MAEGPPPSPANPILGSSLLAEDVLDDIIEQILKGEVKPAGYRGRLGTGRKSVDDTLNGGLSPGGITCISAEAALRAVDLCLLFLVTFLVENPSSTAAIVDTTGHLDVLRLYELVITSRQPNTSVDYEPSKVDEENGELHQFASGVLGRVKLMRVFDLVGMKEAIWEIKESLEGPDDSAEPGKQPVVDGASDTNDAKEMIKRTVIADSEDEEDDEELLFETEGENIAPMVQSIATTQTIEEAMGAKSEEEKTPGAKVGFVLIDNFAQVLSPMMKKDSVQAKYLASSLLRALKHLTKSHSLFTVLANPASVIRTASPSRTTGGAQQPVPAEIQRQQVTPPSVFSSNKAIPALGHILPPVIDLHLLLSKLPRRKADARALTANPEKTSGEHKKTIEGVEIFKVVEVLMDRWESRVGAWASLDAT